MVNVKCRGIVLQRRCGYEEVKIENFSKKKNLLQQKSGNEIFPLVINRL